MARAGGQYLATVTDFVASISSPPVGFTLNGVPATSAEVIPGSQLVAFSNGAWPLSGPQIWAFNAGLTIITVVGGGVVGSGSGITS